MSSEILIKISKTYLLVNESQNIKITKVCKAICIGRITENNFCKIGDWYTFGFYNNKSIVALSIMCEISIGETL